MSEVSSEDLATELARRLRDDPDILHKNQGLLDRCILARVEDAQQWDEVLRVFKQFSLTRSWEPRITKASREMQGVPTIGGDPAPSCMPVRDVWEDAPVSSEASCPPHWCFGDRDAAICKLIEKQVDGMTVVRRMPVAFDPILITQRIQQKENAEVFFELAWKVGARWHTHLYPRDVVFNSRKITDCARHGLPIASDNSAEIVQYLRAYEHHNLGQIAVAYCRSATGWLGEEHDLGDHGFLVGDRQVGGNGQKIHYTGESASEFGSSCCSCLKCDACAKSFAKWREAIAMGNRWPALRVALVASLAAPLIGIVGAPNVAIEWVSDTSGGKTVALRYARSAWCSAKAKIPTWNATVNGLEMRVQSLNDLPMFIDDTAQVPESKRRDVLGAAVYMLESGHTRARATKDLMPRASKTWRTIVLSTGEYALADYVGTGGAAARVLTFYGPPLGPPSPATGATARELMTALGKNYGHAGPMFVKWLCAQREKWDDFELEYSHLVKGVREALLTSSPRDVAPSSMRLADTIALLQLTSRLATKAGVLADDWSPLSDPYVVATIEQAIGHAANASNKARDAWEIVLSVAASKDSQWIVWGKSPESKNEPHGGWLGWRRVAGGAPNDAYRGDSGTCDLLAWYPSQLRSVLASHGYAVEATLKSWRQAGVLVTRPERLTFFAKCAGVTSGQNVYLMKTTETPWNEPGRDGTKLEDDIVIR